MDFQTFAGSCPIQSSLYNSNLTKIANLIKRNVMSYNTFYPEINTFWPVRFVNSTALWYKFFIFQMILSIVVECPMQSTAGHHLLYALGYAHIASMVDNNNTMVQAC